MQRLCVFCGSREGNKQEYRNGAKQLGELLAKRNIELVYGGASVGMMAEVANAVIDHGGNVRGIMPEFLATKEKAHKYITKMEIVETMHDRKRRMTELADAFIALPGGIGTMEEYFEVMTLAQLGKHHKRCGLLNIDGYYDQLLEFFYHMKNEGFIDEDGYRLIVEANTVEDILDKVK
ncbi:TIGR00730 family Rossman fold protein [Texcoconibacillus texcoconensis]|uniref:Cytokinin riboside 5'-monophosphate phosphoribohydrolase n=1 Tax=Texcoconibacillus texcoconensis TaxID=1095777 RepID=A0A840QPU1_9BACI|nr:TIGR00730 family Rossman fold protein [Texcoconibacillus texcoconensis]MBB5173337.1 hypothetical protein [Texcoconibacillus texcoconensis]